MPRHPDSARGERKKEEIDMLKSLRIFFFHLKGFEEVWIGLRKLRPVKSKLSHRRPAKCLVLSMS